MTTASSGCRILIVEDDAATAEILAAHLEAAGYQALTADNGLRALEAVRQYKPRIIISDWVMPEMDGLEFCRAAKSACSEDFVYFIMLTVHSARADLMKAFDAGVDDFVAKPYDPGELLARVRAGLRAVSLYEQLAERTRTTDRLNAELNRLNRRLARQACTDELTGLLNRRQALRRLKEHWDIAERYNHPLSCLMVDIDHFKSINDRYGHPVGDDVLREAAEVLVSTVRTADSVFRFGGEEFVILLPSQAARGAELCAERCRVQMESHRFSCLDESAKVTISIGVAERAPDMAGLDDLLRAADRALYAAKNGGRNRTAVGAVDRQ